MSEIVDHGLFGDLAALTVLGPYLVICLGVGFAVIVLFQFFSRGSGIRSRAGLGPRSSNYLSLLILTLSFLGGTVGFTGGWSRTGVVGDLIPAALALVGGLTVYLFDKKTGRGIVAAISALTFTIALFVGLAVGAHVRNPIDRFSGYRDFCFEALKDPDIVGKSEAYCRFLSGAGRQCFPVLFKDSAVYYFPDKTQSEIADLWLERKTYLDQHEQDACGASIAPGSSENPTPSGFPDWPKRSK